MPVNTPSQVGILLSKDMSPKSKKEEEEMAKSALL
jgi:hypothetical protein